MISHQTVADAFAKYRAGDDEPAKTLYAACAAGDAWRPEALYLLGLVTERRGDLSKGKVLINQAIAERPEIDFHDYHRARLLQQGRLDHRDHAERRFQLYLASLTIDSFLISYPKCGRTWLRLLLGKYAVGFEGDQDPIEVYEVTRGLDEFPSLEISHDDYPHWKAASLQCTDKRAFADKNVVFLVRDPRDAIVSYYFQYVKRGDRKHAKDDFDGSISEFVQHEIGGLRSITNFYNIWAANATVPKAFMMVTYEDLSADPVKSLGDIVSFLGWPDRGTSYLERVVEFGKFENMRKMEARNTLNNSRLSPPKDGDPEGFKTRKGKVGGYRDYLSDDDCRYIDDYLAANLDATYAYGQLRG